MIGQHCIKTWSKTQAIVAKSSAESELYGVVKASCEALATLTLLEEVGAESTARVNVYASAAKGIIERTGLDKIRHIDVNVLWLQEQEVRGRVPLRKIDGTKSTADLMTKHLEVKKIEVHLDRLGLEFRGGRAQAAANLYSTDVYDSRKVIWEGQGDNIYQPSQGPWAPQT